MAKHFEVTETAVISASRRVRRGRLEVVGEDRTIEIGSERLIVGRAAECDLVLEDPSVSALHAEVRVTPAGIHLLDLGSSNGTYLGETRVGEVWLNSEVEFACGSRRLRFVPGAPETVLESPEEPTSFGPLVGATPSMRAIFHLLRKVAPKDVAIVITGETGTGKEVVARAIHEASGRRDKPFVAINCAEANVTLLEDELFGHVRGAFTGAVAEHAGVFEQADGGTLFLDEFGDMPPEMQGKMLRALETARIRRLGSGKERKVDVRVIAATNVDLEAKINRGAFRMDLLYRVNKVRVQLPPLRDRLEDLPLLVGQLLTDLGRRDVALDERALRALQARDWPGNVRELRNVLEVALADSEGGELSLDEAFRHMPQLRVPRSSGPLDSVLARMTWPAAKQELRRRYFTALFGECRGNISQMAKRALVQRAAVREALRKINLGVEHDDEDEENDEG
jgi:DNA-binding NtrC family response regulator